jgi:hypothetical protein
MAEEYHREYSRLEYPSVLEAFLPPIRHSLDHPDCQNSID